MPSKSSTPSTPPTPSKPSLPSTASTPSKPCNPSNLSMSSYSFSFLQLEIRDNIALLTINRPEALNALNLQVLNELKQVFIQCSTAFNLSPSPSPSPSLSPSSSPSPSSSALNPSLPPSALIITGAGEKSFIAGADIAAMQTMSQSEILQFITLGQEVTNLIENAPFPTIAAVNGYALGGGLEIALACDFIYASKNAKLGLPEVSLAIIPGFGGTQRLSRAIGTRRAKELIFTGQPISADEAYRLGIVNHVCDREILIQTAFGVAEKIGQHSQLAIYQAKEAINHGIEMPLNDALILEKNQFAVTFATSERKIAMGKFLDKGAKK